MMMAFFKIARFLLENAIIRYPKRIFILMLSIACTVISSCLEGVAYFFMIGAFTVLVGENFERLSFFSSITGSFPWLFFIACGSQILKSSLSFLGMYVKAHLAEFCQAEIQKRVYQKILSLDFAAFNAYKTGELAQYAVSPAVYLKNLIEAYYQCLTASTLILVSCILLALLSWPLTLFVFISVGGILYVQKSVLQKVFTVSLRLSKKVDALSSETIQSLGGMRLVHLYNRNNYVLDKVSSLIQKGAMYTRKLSIFNALQISFSEIISIILVGTSLVFGYLILQWENAHVLSTLLGFIAITYRMSGRMQAAVHSFHEIGSLQGFIHHIMVFLSRDTPEQASHEKKIQAAFQKSITLHNLGFMYPKTTAPVLTDFHFTIHKGSIIALVGKSGAGKSTLIDLVTGLYVPTEGEILLDDKKMTACDLKGWREKIGVVSQDAFFFNDSIEMNIRLGKHNASLSEVVEAAKRAHADEFINKLPAGYRTRVGERGYRLSGGEKQRLALARALIRDPEIIILDEATSQLDVHSETLIQETFQHYKGKKTFIIVAHRLSTVMFADTILFLERGRILESGTHYDLLEKKGHYAAFWDMHIQKQKNKMD